MSVRAVFLWHLHQPEYRDPESGQPLLPWVRLHSTRAYTDMAAALERFPKARGVVNWAPSLLLQLEAYTAGRAVDLDEELARKPVNALSPGERAHVIKESFSVDWDLWVAPVPRYAQLLEKRGREVKQLDLLRTQETFADQDLIDLQIHFALSWMGFAARAEQPLVRELLAKERGFTELEKRALLELQRRIAQQVLPRWQALVARGQVEITCSPLFHPILPLLVDSDCARRAMPEATLPPRFAWPEDARLQVVRGLDVAERCFGVRPRGMWPSEGSVSPEVIELLAEAGLSWCASDEGVLARSELLPAPGASGPARLLPWLGGTAGKSRDFTLLFRDREISDLIGFRYAKGEAESGARDLVRRIAAAAGVAREPLVTIALDGENPWEHYPHSGEDFLSALYAQLSRDDAPVRVVLPKDELKLAPATSRIARLHSGSWIEANFRIWIGEAEDNAAWTLLGEARTALAAAEREGRLPPEQLERAREALLPAEGSDWFWWYGDDFSTENAAEFDSLFRRWVSAAFRALGVPAPEALGRPIIAAYKDKTQGGTVVIPPRRLIAPVIDGYSRGFYEWLGAGLYRPGQSLGGSMHQGAGLFQQLWFGFSLKEIFLRLDPRPESSGLALADQLRLSFTRNFPPGAIPWEKSKDGSGREEKTLLLKIVPGGAEEQVRDERGTPCGAGRSGAIVELSLSQAALGVAPGDRLGLTVQVLGSGVERERWPRYGELTLEVPDKGFEQAHWQV